MSRLESVHEDMLRSPAGPTLDMSDTLREGGCDLVGVLHILSCPGLGGLRNEET